MLWGVVLFGYVLGGLASMLTNSDAQRARYIHRLDTIKEHLVNCESCDNYRLDCDCVVFVTLRYHLKELLLMLSE